MTAKKDHYKLLEYVHHYNLDQDIQIRFKHCSYPIHGRLSIVTMGVAELLDGLIKVLSLGFIVSHFEESLLWDIYKL